MTDKWQSGKTYPPGSLVIPASQPAVDATSAENGDFAAGNSGWDYTGSCTFSSTGGYSNANCCIAPGVTAGGLALNKAKFLMSPGETISANCMIQQGASDVDHTRGYVQMLFFDASDAQIDQPVSGNIVNDGRGGAWHPSSVQATAPAGTSYARCGIYLYQNSADPIWGDNLVVYYARRKPPAGLIFKATQANPGKSAQTEPVWPTSTGVTVTDNEVTWEGVIATRLVWEASPILKSGATEPTWATSVGGAVHDGTIDWLAASRRVEDVNCPNTKIVAIAAGKVYAADNDIIRYCATVNPLDWSATDDAGYLPFGLQTYGSNPIAAMGLYRSNLVAFNSEGFQMWQVDPDPASITLLDALPVASTHNKALAPVANDLLFLSSLGVRSIGIAASSVNLQAGDVGMPVDVLVRDSVRVAAANNTPVLATYYPSAGQYWLAFPNYPPSPLALAGSLPKLRYGDSGTFQYTESGGVLPYGAFGIAGGALPPWANMNADGLVTYSVTATGSWNWTVSGQDADNHKAMLDDSTVVASEILTKWNTIKAGDSSNCLSVAVSDGIILACFATTLVYSSDKGTTWVAAIGNLPSGSPVNCIAFNGSWYLIGNSSTAAVSSGDAFNFVTMANAPYATPLTATVMTNADHPNGALYVGAYNATNSSLLRMNAPGDPWTIIDTGFSYGRVVAMCQAGLVYFVVCSSGKILRSNDLINFVLVYDSADINLSKCAYLQANGVVIVTNDGGDVYRSADTGGTWTKYPARDVTYVTATRQEFIGGRDNVVKKSNDGITWIDAHSSLVGTQYRTNFATDGSVAVIGRMAGYIDVGTP